MSAIQCSSLSYGVIVRTIILNTIENTIYRVTETIAGIYTVCNVEENNTLHYVVLVLS